MSTLASNVLSNASNSRYNNSTNGSKSNVSDLHPSNEEQERENENLYKVKKIRKATTILLQIFDIKSLPNTNTYTDNRIVYFSKEPHIKFNVVCCSLIDKDRSDDPINGKLVLKRDTTNFVFIPNETKNEDKRFGFELGNKGYKQIQFNLQYRYLPKITLFSADSEEKISLLIHGYVDLNSKKNKCINAFNKGVSVHNVFVQSNLTAIKLIEFIVKHYNYTTISNSNNFVARESE